MKEVNNKFFYFNFFRCFFFLYLELIDGIPSSFCWINKIKNIAVFMRFFFFWFVRDAKNIIHLRTMIYNVKLNVRFINSICIHRFILLKRGWMGYRLIIKKKTLIWYLQFLNYIEWWGTFRNVFIFFCFEIKKTNKKYLA